MIRHRPSPNVNDRRGNPVDILLLHYTGMKTGVAALDRLTDPTSAVSCHYLIDEDGTCYQLADETARAWHAGVGYWAGATDINSRSIGIELVNPGHEWGYRPFPPAQMYSLATLAQDILGRHPIPPHRVLGHSDIAPLRKQDPGELFDWAWLHASGIGLWPDIDAPEADLNPRDALGIIGYGPLPDAPSSPPVSQIIAAFQRHFCPGNLSGILDAPTMRRLRQVAAAIPVAPLKKPDAGPGPPQTD